MNRLKYYRGKEELTQAQLAEKAGVGAHYIAEVESGIKLPSLRLFLEVCSCLDVPAACFLQTGEDAMRLTNPKLHERISGYDNEKLSRLLDVLEAMVG